MSNGAECCAIGVCCPPASAERLTSLAKVIARDSGLTHDQSIRAATCVIETFDLAIKGTLQPLIDSIAAQARAAHT